jgi:hypothetical protein
MNTRRETLFSDFYNCSAHISPIQRHLITWRITGKAGAGDTEKYCRSEKKLLH